MAVSDTFGDGVDDNISVAPGVIWLTAPGHNSDNSDIIVGTLRTTFEF